MSGFLTDTVTISSMILENSETYSLRIMVLIRRAVLEKITQKEVMMANDIEDGNGL